MLRLAPMAYRAVSTLEPHCWDHCSSGGSSQSASGSPPALFFFEIVFTTLDPLKFHLNLGWASLFLQKKTAIGILTDYTERVDDCSPVILTLLSL